MIEILTNPKDERKTKIASNAISIAIHVVLLLLVSVSFASLKDTSEGNSRKGVTSIEVMDISDHPGTARPDPTADPRILAAPKPNIGPEAMQTAEPKPKRDTAPANLVKDDPETPAIPDSRHPDMSAKAVKNRKTQETANKTARNTHGKGGNGIWDDSGTPEKQGPRNEAPLRNAPYSAKDTQGPVGGSGIGTGNGNGTGNAKNTDTGNTTPPPAEVKPEILSFPSGAFDLGGLPTCLKDDADNDDLSLTFAAGYESGKLTVSLVQSSTKHESGTASQTRNAIKSGFSGAGLGGANKSYRSYIQCRCGSHPKCVVK